MVTRRTRWTFWSTLAALAVVVIPAGMAWACTPQAVIYLDSPSIDQDGSTVTVTGKGFIPGPVKIRIDSGRPLATATGPEFSVPVQIPAAKPGIYYVKVEAYKPDGTVAGQATRALRVKAPAPAREAPRPTKQPAPRRERTQATPKQPAVVEQPVETPAVADAPPAVTDAPLAATRREAATAAEAKPAAKPARPAKKAQARPEPRIAPSVSPGRDLWGVPAPAQSDASASDDARLTLVIGIALIALGLGGLGGYAYARIRTRPRPPGRRATGREALPFPESETGVLSIEDELDELIAARSGDPKSPRETSDAPG